MTEPPLELPPRPFDTQYSGINPNVMDRFESLFGRAGDLLRQNEPMVRHVLEKLRLDASGLRAMREAEIWIRGKKTELRRRNDTIKAVNDTWQLEPGTGLVGLDEELHKKVSYDPDAYAAAIFVREAAKSGEVNKQALAQLEKHAKDPQFALKLLNALGPEKFKNAAATAVLDEKDKDKQRLLAALGTALGAASGQLSSEWRRRLTSNLDLGPHRGLARVLTHGTYNSSFLLEVARKMDAAERGRARSDTHLRHPMADVMEALSKNPQAAQDFFNAGDTLKYYVTAHTLNDGGKALGKALEAATITFRDHAGSESHPSPGYISAKLASHLVHYEYERIKSGKLAKSPVDPLSLGRIMAAYTPDITRVATLPGIEKPGVYMEDNAGNIAKIDLAGEMDEMQQRHVKAFMAVINTGLAFPQRASWPIGATILSSWTGMIEDSFKGTARREAIFAANTTAEQTRFLLHQLAAQAMLDHGLYGSRGEPSRSHPWAWLHSRNPDQDPLKSSNNFLDEDGRLMTPEQMRQGSGERLNAYQAWLYREPQGNPMKDLGILSQLNEGFTLGISIYK